MGDFLAGYLGLVPYESALRLQERLAQARAENSIPDVLLLLQHPPVFTIGRFRGQSEILVSPEMLSREGIQVFQTNRGGSVTYHGPGQLVGYPILNLKEVGLSVREYVWKLEETIIRVLADFGIAGRRDPRYPGVWVGKKKIGSLGINVSHHITTHGFALNVSTNLRHFDLINPCGITGVAMTSICEELGHPVEMETVIQPLINNFAAVFGVNCIRDDSLAQSMPHNIVSVT